jgi:hypothetical protein
MDSLIGHLDGADCQFMLISPESGEFRMQIKCKEWSRVPWFDAVHHNTFSLHGAGYSNRYEAQRGRSLHGIESDDYIVSEILTGHSLMADWGSEKRGAVRKYWLAQDLVRHLADKHIEKVEFVDNNIQHLLITWSGGTKIYVNQGKDDWKITPPDTPGRTLPQYGYFADSRSNGIVSGISRDGSGKIIETGGREDEANGKSSIFVNARQTNSGNVLPLLPKLKSFKYLGSNKFSAEYIWKTFNSAARQPASLDYAVFIHCTEKQINWHHKPKEAFLSGGGYQKTPVPEWKGDVQTEPYESFIPDDLPAGRYYLVVGLYDAKGNGHRAKLLGLDTGADRYAVARLKVERGQDGKITSISAEPVEWEDEALSERLIPSDKPADFDFVRTSGAFRIESDNKAKTHKVIPLPNEPATEIALAVPAKSVKAVDADGKELRDVPFRQDGRYTVFTTQKDEFLYKIAW